MILGITGGTGCGKTTLLRLLAAQGAVICDCDAIYHRLLQEDEALLDAIRRRFPQAFPDGIFQRKRLGEVVFSDPAALSDLNAITHAAVRREVERQLTPRPRLGAIDAIALFESGLDALCDVTVAVTAPEEVRIARLMARDGISRDYAQSRIQAQKEPEWFARRCRYRLENDTTPEEFARKCLAFFRQIHIIEENPPEAFSRDNPR